ncbi:MAG: glycosyltransferase family 4 protein, partial [Solirubrobacterales bacterium]|nr:glycosyltransferase family 4 protein [Solirubrobacterales bacterium]
GIDLTRQAAVDRHAARARIGLAGPGPLLGVAAQITPWKGQAMAIRALRGVRQRLPRAQLVLVGEPKFVARTTRYDNSAYLGELRSLVAALRLESAVHFLGQRDDMPTVMAGIDVLLVPSTEEPFGLVVVEAMAAGTPVVATTDGGPAEIIRDGIDGRLVPPRDAERWASTVCDVLLDPTARARLTEAGHDRARRFSAERYATEVVAGYERALCVGC